ncbi:alkaline-phosphatase-like protein [Dactylonectria macrodidyma]|uniref:Alkaline-phosphatase-like protein n=1 Tax=Dactylonectria macrodidyma TaxID=307937 RepID=A0A9P9DMG9_9HYPO|nr:alkaline-phosphatase-like protein [Dactylonectria macrodidyma]
MSATFVPYCFSIIVVSVTLTKLVHLYVNANLVPPGLFVLYFPSFLLPDALVIFTARLALRRERGWVSLPMCALGCLMAFIILCAASSQLGFFYETNAEMEWRDAAGFASDADGLKVLLSGMGTVLVAGMLILFISWFAKAILYKAVGALLVGIGAPLIFVWRSALRLRRPQKTRPKRRIERQPDWSSDSEDYSNYGSDFENDSEEAVALVYGEKWADSLGQSAKCFQKTRSWVAIAAALVFLAVTTILRPSTPYNQISTTLPFPLLDMFQAKPDPCAEQGLVNNNQWPFPDLTDASNWEEPSERSKGWAPGADSKLVKQYRQAVPAWLPSLSQQGFHKWASVPSELVSNSSSNDFIQSDPHDDDDSHLKCNFAVINDTFYNPVNDPMKITNLENEVLPVLQEALNNGSVKIKHIALIMMESVREELFPIQQGSGIHKFIMDSHKKGEMDHANALVSRLSPNAEKITGKSGNFVSDTGLLYEQAVPEWNDTTRDGFGGINVQGALTTSSASTKSFAAIHCGTWPMPVDMFEESETLSYQPCITEILELFNKMKENTSTTDYKQQEWYPGFFQSITDGYDRQDKFEAKIGFKHIVNKEKLDIDATDADDLEEINYFGYGEKTVKSHIEDYLKKTVADGQRIFFTHFTSTTHHPWGVPSTFNSEKYMNTRGTNRWHKDFNKYLNAIRYTDAWMGEMMQMFDDLGIANETLVVFVGDHGQAFKEDDFKTGTYENGHISNFRVPITFRHPNLPRVQYKANSTSVSILPTILDLLINSGSLNADDTTAASDIVQDYEGQSFLREYKTTHNGRRAWNFGVVNAGGRMLSVTSADAPWRLVVPLDTRSPHRFTDIQKDPLELDPLLKWSVKSMAASAKRKHGGDAGEWVVEAEAVAKWWGLERKRLWGYQAE